MPETEIATTLVALDLLGIFVFAVTGALVAVRKNLDVFAALVLAGVTGLGGGFIRDVLIDATPPAALTDWRYLLAPVAAGLLTFAFHPVVGRLERVLTLFDAVGLALFCVTGALKAVDYGLDPVPAASLDPGETVEENAAILRAAATLARSSFERRGLRATVSAASRAVTGGGRR